MDTKTRVLSTIEEMVGAFHRGDVDGILRTYERAAVVVGEPGSAVQGEGALREMFGGFIAARAHFSFDGHEVLIADDIALHLTPWRMTGVAPDGSGISGAGFSVAVLRRQADGRWLLVIDNPHGDHMLQRASASAPQGGTAR
jgi:ketosteroid isomerase-like protein